MPSPENELVAQAKRYLKQTYGEDTISMVITKNAVNDGTGPLAVDCTVSVGSHRSDWSKVFHFSRGAIVKMDFRRR